VLDVATDLALAPVEGVWRLLEVDSGVLAVHACGCPKRRAHQLTCPFIAARSPA